MTTRASVGWMAATTLAVIVSACGSSSSNGGAGDGGTSSGGASGSGGSGGSGSGSGGSSGGDDDASASGSGSGSGGIVFSNDASPGSSEGGDVQSTGCPIATIGSAGGAGQGSLFNDWLSSQGESASGNLGDQVLTSALLAPYKILVAQDVSKNHTYSASEVAALQAWITAGGGFMTMLGYDGATNPPEGTNVDLLLAPYGMNYGSAQILPDNSAANPVTNWVSHPVTQGITEIGFNNGYEVQGSGTFLANESGYNLLEVQTVGSGHVLMWGDEWITYDSFWSQYPQFQVKQFWQNIVNWFAPTGGCQVPSPPK